MTENDITNAIWRKWQEQKIKPPMTWQQLWDKVREYIKAGKDPYLLLAPTALARAEAKPDKLKDLFAGRTLEGYVEAAKVRTLETFKGVTFYFETKEERERARELLSRHNFYFPYGPEISLTDIDDPDYMLELLAYEGFDTSKILVER